MSDLTLRRCAVCNQGAHCGGIEAKCQCECGDKADLVAFLSARLDEDRAAAQAATEDPGMAAEWHETTSGCLDVGLPDHGGEDWRDYVWPQGDSRVTRFIATNDPAHVLRRVEADRVILNEHSPAWDDGAGVLYCPRCMTDLPRPINFPCPTLCAIAAVYRDHPDYDPAWTGAPR